MKYDKRFLCSYYQIIKKLEQMNQQYIRQTRKEFLEQTEENTMKI